MQIDIFKFNKAMQYYIVTCENDIPNTCEKLQLGTHNKK